jgi:repressor LexA
MFGLTETQQKVLDYIKLYSSDKGYPPSIQEVSEYFGWNRVGAYSHVKAIEKKGFIKRVPGKSRTMRVVN